jgi:sugar phosphate isomerase/epimerase
MAAERDTPMRVTRRGWHRATLGALAAAVVAPLAHAARKQAPAGGAGVTLGVQSYSFRDRPLDAALAAMRQLGLTSCELWHGHVEPRGLARGALRIWRESVPLDELRAWKQQFDDAGIRVSAYNISFRDDFSDREIERGFEVAEALGARVITASANTGVVSRVAPVAARRRVLVGMHNHSRIDPDEFATPEQFETAMKAGPFIAVNLDIGHFTAANFDAVSFLTSHHDRIVSLHLKDRTRNQGPNVPWGRGDTPIGAVLRLLRDRRWPIPANIEYEYEGGDTIQEVRRCLEFCRRELAS